MSFKGHEKQRFLYSFKGREKQTFYIRKIKTNDTKKTEDKDFNN